LVPQRSVSYALLALVILEDERVDEALDQAALEPYEMWRTWALSIIQSAAGNSSASDEDLRKLIDKHADGNAYQIAEVHAMRGEADAAFEWLDKAFAERDSGLTHAQVNPRFRPLQDDPRWPDLLVKIGFEI
ncbi:MAG TPA: hypothetical protein VK612_07710, partial [Pyrinomonadaceae bacterium]|nr:hypothetical protein [Pyrinomonadaceae bacterium]